MNQAGVRTEKLWLNFTPDRVHWARFAGKNFTDFAAHQAQARELGAGATAPWRARAPCGAGGAHGRRGQLRRWAASTGSLCAPSSRVSRPVERCAPGAGFSPRAAPSSRPC